MRRTVAIALWVIYTVSVLVFGSWPHHHEQTRYGPERNCAACIWQTTNITDPAQFIPSLVAQPGLSFVVAWPAVVMPTTDFEPATAIRAPPCA
jgi:hypothetical protein